MPRLFSEPIHDLAKMAPVSDWYLKCLAHDGTAGAALMPVHILLARSAGDGRGCMATVDRNEFLRGALAAGAASFASSVATNYIAHLAPSPAVHELANVMRLLDAASDRLVGALADARGIDPAVVAALEAINEKALAIAGQVETALPLG
jgi:hypothetical protein